MYEREDWSLFRNLTTLAQKAGVPLAWLRRLVVKEAVDNALDATGSCKFGRLEDGTYFVEDHGPGIPGSDEEIASLFSIKRPLRSSKLERTATRGALGNGLRVVVGAVLASGGKLSLTTRGRTLNLVPLDSGETIIKDSRASAFEGTRIEVSLGEAVPSDPDEFVWAEEAVLLSEKYVGKQKRISTSAHWYDSGSFFDLVQAAKGKTVREVVERFDGCTGAKSGRIAKEFHGRSANSLNREEADRLLGAMRKHSKAVTPKRIGYIGKHLHLPPAYCKVTGIYKVSPGTGVHNAMLPFVVEVFAETIKDDDDSITCLLNRSPVTTPLEIQRQKTKAEIAIFHCGLGHRAVVGRRAIKLLLNVQSPFVPFTSDGKAPDLSALKVPILEAIEKAARKAARAERAMGDTKTSEKSLIVSHLDGAIRKVSGGGKLRYSLRRLFYVVRAMVEKVIGKSLNYNNYAKVISELESTKGKLVGLYRDPRGILYHPHLKKEIPLGTISVEKYTRPDWIFNKILYVEKEGVFPMLIDDGFPERHDCALLTSKGFASGAAKDVLDLISETSEEISFFAIHDADASGTLIYETLQKATLARGERKVEIENWGLEPSEGVKMGLQHESIERVKGGRAVASYVDDKWKKWLQTKRIELDAMPGPQFLAWLELKMKKQSGKIIPPSVVLETEFAAAVRAKVTETVTQRILEEAGHIKRIDAAIKSLEPRMNREMRGLPSSLKKKFRKTPEAYWKDAIVELASKLSEGEGS